jgi:hypothetical protein
VTLSTNELEALIAKWERASMNRRTQYASGVRDCLRDLRDALAAAPPASPAQGGTCQSCDGESDGCRDCGPLAAAPAGTEGEREHTLTWDQIATGKFKCSKCAGYTKKTSHCTVRNEPDIDRNDCCRHWRPARPAEKGETK